MKNINDAYSVLRRTHLGDMVGAAIALLVAGIAVQGNAQTISLAGSSLQLNATTGLTGWTVDGGNQLNSQSYYYSLGGGLVNNISTLSAASTPAFGGQSFLGAILSTNVSVTYENSALDVTTKYILEAAGSGSEVASTFTIVNASAASEILNFYQFSDFALGGLGGQSVQFVPGASNYAMGQTGHGMVLTGQLSALTGGGTATVGEIAGVYDGTQFGLENGNASPNFNSSVLSASGSNVDFGYEFEATLNPGASLIISEIQVVPEPEPASFALVSAGMLGVCLLKNRRTFSKKTQE